MPGHKTISAADSDRARPPCDSIVVKTEIVLPQHTNAIGTAFGGTVMSWIDVCAAVSAQRHCGRVAVTASVDALDFVAPIRLGDVVTLTSRIHCVFRSSMEVGVKVEREVPGDRTRVICADALLTFVNIGEDGKPAPMPALLLENEEDEERARAARARRAHRLAHKRGEP
ncbi:MAG: acyl-CoA hydrolase [Polyangiales bacterium]|jgi:acyl-CoA hydrolase